MKPYSFIGTRAGAWIFASHAEQRRAQMGLCTEEVTTVLDDPDLVYPARHGLRIAVGGRLAVVHDPRTGIVVTVLWDRLERRAA
jgi:hypothetical protein